VEALAIGNFPLKNMQRGGVYLTSDVNKSARAHLYFQTLFEWVSFYFWIKSALAKKQAIQFA
jgi:hypothetical protein